jgi:hypothetical protein
MVPKPNFSLRILIARQGLSQKGQFGDSALLKRYRLPGCRSHVRSHSLLRPALIGIFAAIADGELRTGECVH